MAIAGLELRKKLRPHFGFHRFSAGQARAIRAALEGRDTLVLMPTGSRRTGCGNETVVKDANQSHKWPWW